MVNTLELFERKFALYVILAVKDNPGMTKTEVLRLDNGNERTKFLRINELIEEGIISVKNEREQHNAMRLYLTPKGQEISVSIEKIRSIMEKD